MCIYMIAMTTVSIKVFLVGDRNYPKPYLFQGKRHRANQTPETSREVILTFNMDGNFQA